MVAAYIEKIMHNMICVTFNVANFSDTVNVTNVQICMIDQLTELYLLLTLTIFQGQRSIKQFEMKMLCSYQIKLKIWRILKFIK